MNSSWYDGYKKLSSGAVTVAQFLNHSPGTVTGMPASQPVDCADCLIAGA